jgi:hypothetical protein
MTKTKRIVVWTLGLLLGLPLLLGGTWLLLNLRDVPAQPWPERLALPGNSVPEGENLLLQLSKAPALKPPVVSVNSCKEDDCLPLWRERLPQLVSQREANPLFSEACARLSAAEPLRIEDPLPAQMSVSFPLPSFQPLVHCHQDLLARALSASESGDGAQALRWLQQADRMGRTALTGGRTLIAQMIGVSLTGRKLEVISGVAQRHPELRTALLPLAALDGRALLAKQRQWVIVEANYMRAATDDLRPENMCPEAAPLGWRERLLCKTHAMGYQPEYTEQLMRDRWLQVLAELDSAQDLPSALPAMRARGSKPGQTSPWQRLRHTVAHVLDDVARPAHAGYLERAADLQLAAEATRLWLRQAPLSDASPALRERLNVDAGWQLTPFNTDSRGRLPLRWPPLT